MSPVVSLADEGYRRLGPLPVAGGGQTADQLAKAASKLADYEAAGATLATSLTDAIGKADILLKVRAPVDEEIAALKAGAIVAATLNPHIEKDALKALAAGATLPLLQWLGYLPGSQDPLALQRLAWTYALLPCALKLMAAWLLHRLLIASRNPTQGVTS